MALFRKRKQDGPEDGADFVDDLDEQSRAAEDAELAAALDGPDEGDDEGAEGDSVLPKPLVRPTGPWDVTDAPEDGLQRLDLGAMQVPVPNDVEVRVELNEEGAVVAATLVHADSTAQLMVFAAPRTEGIWDEVVEEILASVTESGGEGTPATGPWGTELLASIPTQTEQYITRAEVRFVGVDGPRWFLRALLTGPAARDSAAAAALEEAVRGVVVVRGTDPMAVRDALPLVLPPDVEQARIEAQAAEQAAAQASGQPDLSLPERGPEITEVH